MKALKSSYTLAVLIGIGSSIYSCSNNRSNTPPDQNTSASQVQSTDSSGTVASRSVNATAEEKTKMKGRITELSTKIDTATARIDHQLATADAKTKKSLTEERANLSRAKEKLKADLDKFSTTADKDWDKAKADISNSVDSLEKKLKLD